MPRGNSYSMVITTTDSSEEAESLAAALVDSRLAACVQLCPIVSYYRWQGATTRTDEILLLMKTQAAKVEAIKEYLDQHHSYDTPEVIEIPITSGLAGYLSWIDEQLA